jgi:hypothetical protein
MVVIGEPDTSASGHLTSESLGGDAVSTALSAVCLVRSMLSMLAAGSKSLLASKVPEVTTIFTTHIPDVSLVVTDVESVLENLSESFWCNDFEGLKESGEI